MFVLLFAYELYANDQAVVFLKRAAPFARADHPLGFIVCTLINFGFGLASLFFGVRAIYRSLVNRHLNAGTDRDA